MNWTAVLQGRTEFVVENTQADKADLVTLNIVDMQWMAVQNLLVVQTELEKLRGVSVEVIEVLEMAL